MARISVDGEPFESFLLSDLDKKQQLREHTIHPPGQEQYVKPIDKGELKDKLQEIAANNGGSESDVTDSDVDTFISNTVGSDDISVSNVQTESDATFSSNGTSTSEADELRDIISTKFVETGNFLLSFNDGVVGKAKDNGWIKVFPDTGSGTFSL